jgi:hypothetical protein
MLFYGFVLENNEFDLTQFRVVLHPDDPLKEVKESLFDFDNNPRILKIGYSAEDKRFAKLMSYMRYLVYEGDSTVLKHVWDYYIKLR